MQKSKRKAATESLLMRIQLFDVSELDGELSYIYALVSSTTSMPSGTAATGTAMAVLIARSFRLSRALCSVGPQKSSSDAMLPAMQRIGNCAPRSRNPPSLCEARAGPSKASQVLRGRFPVPLVIVLVALRNRESSGAASPASILSDSMPLVLSVVGRLPTRRLRPLPLTGVSHLPPGQLATATDVSPAATGVPSGVPGAATAE